MPESLILTVKIFTNLRKILIIGPLHSIIPGPIIPAE
jgi:hypothetical protein